MKPKMYLFLVDVDSEHKKAKHMNWNVVATSHNQYKGVLLNDKCLRHSTNRIQSKDRKTGSYEMKKIHCLIFMTKYMFKTMDIMD